MRARIGVMSEMMIRERMLSIVKGAYKPAPNEPKVWFTSLNAVSQLLCEENRELLKIIKHERPETVTELSEITGRKKSNLSNTLKALTAKGFMKLEKKGRTVKPIALYTDFEIVIVDDFRSLKAA
ncbi:TPA: transcriptional regulator [Photobacterium damselae]